MNYEGASLRINEMNQDILLKIETLKQDFAACANQEAVYHRIMDWGRELPPFEKAWKKGSNLVLGCQSLLYLHTECNQNQMHYFAASDALISAGLAALLIFVYNNEFPEIILKTSPKFLEDMGIPASLTPTRANGLASLYLKMKQEAVRHLISRSSS